MILNLHFGLITIKNYIVEERGKIAYVSQRLFNYHNHVCYILTWNLEAYVYKQFWAFFSPPN